MAKTRIIPNYKASRELCVQYTKTESGKWRVTLHFLADKPIVSTSLLDTLPFPLPRHKPWGHGKKRNPNPPIAKATSPFRPEDLVAEDTIILVMETEGYSEEQIAETLRARRDNITEQLKAEVESGT